MANIKCEPGDTIDLSVALYDGATNQYPQAKIYDTGGNLVTTIDLSHIANGLYQGTYTPSGAYKHLTVHYIIYSDSGHTTENTLYSRTMDKLYINYDYKPPSFGMATVEATISTKDKKELVKEIIEKIGLSELLDEIRKKSEFNPKKDKVKTDIKIPAISMRDTKERLDEIKKLIGKIQTMDYRSLFEKTENGLKMFKDTLAVGIKNIKSSIGSIVAIKKTEKITSPQDGLIDEIIELKESLSPLEKMLEALNKEEHRRNNLILEELRKISQFQKVLSSMMVNKKLTQEDELSEIFDLLKSNIKT